LRGKFPTGLVEIPRGVASAEVVYERSPDGR